MFGVTLHMTGAFFPQINGKSKYFSKPNFDMPHFLQNEKLAIRAPQNEKNWQEFGLLWFRLGGGLLITPGINATLSMCKN